MVNSMPETIPDSDVNITTELTATLLHTEDPVVHPALWNVSYINGNFSNISAIPDIGKGDTIRIWGDNGHVYEGGVTISSPYVCIRRWEGSPELPLITNTSGIAPAINITNTAGNITLQGLNISGNTYTGDGSAVLARGSSDDPLQGLTFTDCTFTWNLDTCGSPVHISYVNGTEITGTTFESNTGLHGGGIEYHHSDNANIDNTTFENNTAIYFGGSAYFYNSDNADIDCTTFDNNTAMFGGGIMLWKSRLTIESTNISSNTAGLGISIFTDNSNTPLIENINIDRSNAGLGSSIFVDNTNILPIENINNSTIGFGGGMFVEDSTLTIENTNINSNNAAFGGGMLIDISTLSIENTNINSNNGSLGGGMFVEDSTLTIENNNIENNNGCLGAGMLIEKTTLTIENTIVNNNNGGLGGGIFFENCAAKIESTTINNNTAGWGGGMVTDRSTLTVENITVNSNTAGVGGGMFIEDNTITIKNAAINSNNATWGGGVLTDRSTLTVENITVNSNNAALGGGMFIENNTITIKNTAINGNTATRGGGMLIDNSMLIIENITISNNTATQEDKVDRSLATLKITAPDYNITTTYGNGVYVNESILTLIKELFPEGLGGGILNYNSTITIQNTAINNNTATKGGGIDTEKSLLILKNNTISNNTATTYGGGIYVNESALTFSNNFFCNDENIYAGITGCAWNTTLNKTFCLCENIAGGPYSAGNVWAKPDGTGFSETHSDPDFDGICDETYVISDSTGTIAGTDYLPLYYNNSRGTVLASSTPQNACVLLSSTSYNHTTPAGYYLPPGKYSVVLTLAGYFNSPVFTTEVTSGCKKQISYTLNDTPVFRHTGTGPSPLTFVANSTKTAADVSEWTWHITNPNGSVTEKTGRDLSAVLTATGDYAVCLNADWADKTTWSETVKISVLDAVPDTKGFKETSVKINGTTVEKNTDGTQTIYINESSAGTVTNTPDSVQIQKTDGTNIKIVTTGVTSSGGNLSGTVQSVTITPPALNAVISETVGNVSVDFAMTMDAYDEDAAVTTEISAGCAADVRNAFSLTCPDMEQIAYTVYFTKSGFDNESAISETVLNFSVKTSWVSAIGGNDYIRILRWKDDGTAVEIIPEFAGISGDNSVFQVTTNGFSVYAIASVRVPAPSGSGSLGFGGTSHAGVGAAYDLIAGEVTVLKLKNTAVTEVAILPAVNIRELMITVEQKSGPENDMKPLNGDVYQYDLVTLYKADAAGIAEITYTFEIPKDWLSERNGLPVMWHYNMTSGNWTEYSAEFTGNNAKSVISKVSCPGTGWIAPGCVSSNISDAEEMITDEPAGTAGDDILLSDDSTAISTPSKETVPASDGLIISLGFVGLLIFLGVVTIILRKR
ncbi:right-handed parallel beta-helix repeat-containing protein [Methanoplanus endosymbiosus]|uniref:Right-handed parallel beta-helix repeat-containing protein n=1 Tax=Methanoplanus endosymbiosus TaxID=33865 RepID=A0A9E7PQL8_9EURY|nr:right-handed parallel beta-helix repeat-containing protein [Methanoplanus endosymbiosus]UUX93021.1 right-handed parallel beta-helix repeat-containing protein [Methanoplanus endosymbiosus]